MNSGEVGGTCTMYGLWSTKSTAAGWCLAYAYNSLENLENFRTFWRYQEFARNLGLKVRDWLQEVERYTPTTE